MFKPLMNLQRVEMTSRGGRRENRSHFAQWATHTTRTHRRPISHNGVERRTQDWFGGGREGEKVPFRTMGNTHNKNAPTRRLASSPLRHRQAPVLSSTAPPFTPIAHNAPADTSEKTRCWRYFFRSHAEVGERTDGAGFHEPQGGGVTHRFELVVTGLARVCVHFIRRVCRATVRVSQQCTPS